MGNFDEKRILEMQFDGRDFDKNIRKSQKNLEDFKKSLNFEDAAKQMQPVLTAGEDTNKLLKSMSENMSKLTNVFAGVGNVGTFVAQKIKHAWEGAINSMERFGKSLTTVQISEGHGKYDKLLKSVQTIKNATGDAEEYVYGIMEQLNRYTDETSYNFSDMAQNIGKFTTVGVKLEDAEKEMEGIANWAALAGQGVNEAQRAMYNISQAMSAGYMLKIDYKSIQNAGMDIRDFKKEAIQAAVAVGTLTEKNGKFFTKKGNKEVNLDNFAETLQFKWFDKKAMEQVFKTFADNENGIGEKAYKAAQRCTTFSDALQAIKDMLSTGWMKTYEAVFGKLSDAMALFSGLCNKSSDMLKKFVDLRNKILERWSLGGGRDSLWGALVGSIESPDGDQLFKGAYGVLDMLDDLAQSVYDAFWDLVRKFVPEEMLDQFDNDVEDKFKFNFIAVSIANATKKVQEFTNKIGKFFNEVDEGQTESRMDKIRHVIEAVLAVGKFLGDIIGGIISFSNQMTAQLAPAFSIVIDLVSYLSQLFTGSIVQGAKKNVVGGFFSTLAALLKPVSTLINAVVYVVAQVIARFAAFAHQSGLMTLLGSAFQWVAMQIGNLANKITSSGIIQTIGAWFQNLIAKIPGAVQKLRELAETLKNNFQNSEVYTGFLGILSKVFGGKGFKEVWDSIKSGVKGFVKKIPGILPMIQGRFSSVFSTLLGFLNNALGGVFGFLFGSAKAEDAEEVVTEGMDSMGKLFEDAASSSGTPKTVTDAIVDAVVPGGGAAATATKSILDRIKDAFKSVWDPIKNFFSNFVNVTIPDFMNSDFVGGLKEFFSGTKFTDLLKSAVSLTRWASIFKTGSGLVSIGKGMKSMGKGVQLFSKNKHFDFGEFGNQLLQIAAAIGLVTAAAVIISKIPQEDLIKAGVAILSIVTLMISAEFLAREIGQGGKGLFFLAAAVTLIMAPIYIIMQFIKNDLGTFETGMVLLAGVLFSLALAARIAGSVNMKGFVSMAAAMVILLWPISVLGKMPVDELKQALIALLAIMLSVGVLGGIIGQFGNAKNSFKGIVGLALGLVLLMSPIKQLANMSLGKVAQGVVPLLLILGAIGGLAMMSKGVENIPKLSGLVVAITALVGVAALIADFADFGQVAMAFGPIILIMGGIIAILAVSKSVDTSKLDGIQGIFLAFMATVAVIIAGAVVMSEMKVDWKLVAALMGGIVLIVVAMGIFLPMLAKMNPAGAVIAILALAAAVAAIMAVVSWLAPMLIGSIGNAMTRISAQLKLMSGLFVDFFARMNEITEESAQHAVNIFSYLKDIVMKFADYGKYAEGVDQFSGVLSSLGNGLALFFYGDEKLPDPSKANSIKALEKLIEIGPSLATIQIGDLPNQLLYLGVGLKLFNTATSEITNAEPPALTQLKNIGTAASEVTGKIPQSIAEDLMYLGVGLMLFNESTKDITTAEPVALAMLKALFGEAGNIEKFTQIPLDSLASQMTGLGGAMSLYAKGAAEVTGLDLTDGAPDVRGALDVLKAVSQSIAGEGDMDEFKIPENMPTADALGLFAGQLEALGTALATYANAASKLEGKGADNGERLIKMLGTIGGYLTPANLESTKAFDKAEVSGGGESGKDTVLGRFAVDVAALGAALGEFAKLPNEGDFSGGLGALSHLANINSQLTSWNIAFLKTFETAKVHGGENSVMGQFAIDIGALGDALKAFAELPSYDSFSGGITALEHLADINSQLTLSNLGFLNIFNQKNFHQSKLKEFSDDIGELGRSLATFAQNVQMEDGTQADFDYAIRALNFMATIRNRLPEVGGVKQWWEGHKEDFGDLSTGIEQIGGALRDFSTKLTEVGTDGKSFDYDVAASGLEAIRQMIGLMNELNMLYTYVQVDQLTEAQDGVIHSRTQLEDAEAYLTSVGKRLTHLANFMAALSQDFSNSGFVMDLGADQGTILDRMAAFAKKVSEVFTSGDVKTEAINNFKNMASALSDLSAVDPSVDFHQPGEKIALGIAEGIRQRESDVVQAVIDVVKSGIDVGQASTEMLDNSTLIVSQISQALADGLDLQPTITPVLDLSQLTAGTSAIDALFNRYELRAGNALARATAAAGHEGPTEVYVQNPTDLTGVQTALASLQTQINELGESIKNIKIVLDSGVVAGGVTDGVDLNLGRKGLYAYRRN